MRCVCVCVLSTCCPRPCARGSTASVERALRAVPEVEEVSVDLESKLATVTGRAEASVLVAAVVATGKIAEEVPETVLRVEGMMCGHWCARVAPPFPSPLPSLARAHAQFLRGRALAIASLRCSRGGCMHREIDTLVCTAPHQSVLTNPFAAPVRWSALYAPSRAW